MPGKQASDIVVKVPTRLIHHGQLYRFVGFRDSKMNALELQAELAEGEKNGLDMIWARIVIARPDGDYPPMADIGTAFFYRTKMGRRK